MPNSAILPAAASRPPDALPDFVYVGAGKSGSTWLSEVLREHPQVFVPEVKDIFFFDQHHERGLDWYAEFFEGRKPHHAVAGELSHDYFHTSEAMQRMRQAVPNARILVCLRDPVDHLRSRFQYRQSLGLPCPDDLMAFFTCPSSARQNDHVGNLRRVLDAYPRAQVKVMFYEDLKADPTAFARDLFTFLGVDPDVATASTQRVVLGAQRSRFPFLTRMIVRRALAARNAGLVGLVGRLKRSALLNAILFQRLSARPALDPVLGRTLFERFAPQYAEIERLSGRPVPDAWRRWA